MPKSSTHDTLLRHFEILDLLKDGGESKTYSDIQQELKSKGYAVTKRTVERDLERLYYIFGAQIDLDDDEMPWKWRWKHGATSNIPSISITETLSLELIKNTLTPLLPASILKPIEPHFTQAAARIKRERTSNTLASWAEKVYQIDSMMPLLPPSIDDNVLEAVQSALMNDKQLLVQYQSADREEPKGRLLHPLGLVQRGPVTYLIATANKYKDAVPWALHRMSKPEVVADKRLKPANFSLRKYVESGKMHFGSAKSIKLKANISEALERILSETPLSHDQKINLKNNVYTLTASVSDTWQLSWWILSKGEEIEVLSPKSLRKSISKSLRNAAAQYTE